MSAEPGARDGLDDDGVADPLDGLPHARHRGGARVPRRADARRVEHLLHLLLVAERDRLGDGHAGQPELLADPRRQDHVRLPQAFHLVEPRVRGEPAQRGQHRALVGQRHVLVVGERVAGHGGQLVRRLVADADHPGAHGGQRPREVRHLGRVAGREHDHVGHCASTSSTRMPFTISASACVDDRGVRVADDHPALALVARRRGLARLGQLRLHHQVPDPPLQLVHAVHGPHAAPALPAQVHAARRVLPRRRLEPVEDHQLAPQPEEVDVVHVPEHRGDLRAGRPGADLRDRGRAVGSAEPLHVREAVAHPEGLHGGRPDVEDLPVARVGQLAGEQHRPLDPRVAQHRERRRPVVRDRRPHRAAADLHAVERELVADEELLQQAGFLRARRDGGEPAAQRVGVVEAVGGLRPGARGRLGHEREPDRRGERQRLLGRADELVARARHARRGEHLLHPGLVPHVVGGRGVHARDAQRVAGLRERHLQLLEGAHQPFDRAPAAATARPRRRRSAAGPARRRRASARRGGGPARAAPAPRTRW